MKYSVKEVRLMAVPQGKNNAGTHYLQMTVQNPNNRWAKPERYTSFNELMIQEFEKYIGIAHPTGQKDQFGRDIYKSPLLNANNPIPAEDLEIPNLFAVIVPTPGEPWIRVDENGNPIMNTKGVPQMVTSIRVLCMRDTDNETGQVEWMQGEVPDQKAMRILQQFYAPASQLGIITGQAKQVVNIAQQTQGQQQQQGAPTQPAQPMQQPGFQPQAQQQQGFVQQNQGMPY